jgi:hypothetical protein
MLFGAEEDLFQSELSDNWLASIINIDSEVEFLF